MNGWTLRTTCRACSRKGSVALRPVWGVALRQHGAMVASGILTAYAGAFAAHVSKHRPGLAKPLIRIIRAGTGGGL
jgi:hypothetical protein